MAQTLILKFTTKNMKERFLAILYTIATLAKIKNIKTQQKRHISSHNHLIYALLVNTILNAISKYKYKDQ
jgi:hypothetical protein